MFCAQRLPEGGGPEGDGGDWDQEGDQEDVGGPGSVEDAEVDDVRQGGGEGPEGEDGEDGGGRDWCDGEGGGGGECGEENEDEGGGGELAGGDGEGVDAGAGEAAGVRCSARVVQGGGEDGELGEGVGVQVAEGADADEDDYAPEADDDAEYFVKGYAFVLQEYAGNQDAEQRGGGVEDCREAGGDVGLPPGDECEWYDVIDSPEEQER